MTPPHLLADRLAAALGDRYTVEREVGSGGMAIVFAARDLRHHRTVAIKVLRPEIAASVGAERFLREIQLVAALQHPHILSVYDSGAGDGVFYYVMPFVDGESLSARIARDGPLPVNDAVRLAREVAGALAYAHAQGVVHRDIKPENILLSNGHALVADFGIARAVDATGSRLTATGMAVGTPMYMSPEQALGSDAVDARSDIYSLGCVLYEMLTGQQPFSGSSLQAIVAQSITAPRPRARKLRRDIPPAIDDIVVKSLAVEPADRFQTAGELETALDVNALSTSSGLRLGKRARTISAVAAAAAVVVAAVVLLGLRSRSAEAAGAVATDARVIAVLPFTAVGADSGRLSEGLVDLISANLDGVGGIRTISPRTTLARWRARAGSSGALDTSGTVALGRELGAGSVLTGSVVALGSSVRVTAELAGLDGVPLAKAQADGPADGILGIVDSLSVRLLRDVWRSSSPVPGLRVSALTTGSLPAMRAYLEGEQLFRRSNWTGAELAYSRAIEQDSSFALAYLRILTTEEWRQAPAGRMEAIGNLLRGRLARLSARERSLAVAALLYHGGQLAAADSALALTQRYPDAIDAWVMLGEIRYHGSALLAPSYAEMRAPFERVLSIDSSLTTAYVHLLDESVEFGDSVRFAGYLGRLRAVAGAADSTVTMYQLIDDAVWGAPAASDRAVRTIIVSRDNALFSLVPGLVMRPAAAQRALAAFRDVERQASDTTHFDCALLLLATGRVQEARAAWRTLITTVPNWQGGYPLASIPTFTGMGDSAATLDALRLSERQLYPRSFGDLAAGERGVLTLDSALVRRSVAALVAIDTMGLPVRFHMLAEVQPGMLRLARGDSAAGAAAIGEVLSHSNFTVARYADKARWMRAVTLSRHAATRAEGIRLLRYGFFNDPEYFGPRQLALRDALLASGDRPAADSASAAFDHLWAGADSSARAALERAFPLAPAARAP